MLAAIIIIELTELSVAAHGAEKGKSILNNLRKSTNTLFPLTISCFLDSYFAQVATVMQHLVQSQT